MHNSTLPFFGSTVGTFNKFLQVFFVAFLQIRKGSWILASAIESKEKFPNICKGNFWHLLGWHFGNKKCRNAKMTIIIALRWQMTHFLNAKTQVENNSGNGNGNVSFCALRFVPVECGNFAESEI